MTKDNDRRAVKRIAARTALYLVLLMLFLVAVALALGFRLGEAAWPAWVSAHRTQLIGLDLLGLFATVCLSPIIIEADSNPRHLSGPGHNPEQGWRR